MNGVIYGLIDSDTLELRYVGQTVQPLRRRYTQHLRGGVNPHLDYWVKSTHISIAVLERGPDNLDKAEVRWIWQMREQGARLINIAEGGGSAAVTPETRTKLSAAQTGKKHTQEAKLKIGAAARGNCYAVGYKHTQKAKDKMSVVSRGNQNTRGRRHTQEAKAKISAAGRGRKVSSETRAKIGAAHAGKRLSPEHRAKLRVMRTGTNHSLETRAKIRAAHAGKTYSGATLARMTVAQRARRAREKSERCAV